MAAKLRQVGSIEENHPSSCKPLPRRDRRYNIKLLSLQELLPPLCFCLLVIGRVAL